MQKKMDEMQAQLELAHSKVGEVLSVESHYSFRRQGTLETSLNFVCLDVCASDMNLINFFRSGVNKWQLCGRPQLSVSPCLQQAASSMSWQGMARLTFVIFKKIWFPESLPTRDTDGTMQQLAMKCSKFSDILQSAKEVFTCTGTLLPPGPKTIGQIT